MPNTPPSPQRSDPEDGLRRLRSWKREHAARRPGAGLVPVRSLLSRGLHPNHKRTRLGGAAFSSRLTRALLPLIVLTLMLVVGRRYMAQRFDLEGQVRRQLLPQLAKQFNTTIEVGRVESDWLNRVILHDIVIGRNARLPLGALAQARRVDLDVDVIALALRRSDLLHALRAVTLTAPQVFVQRDARGRLNLSRLLSRNYNKGGARWAGLVRFREGRLWYEDQIVRSSAGQKLVADSNGVQGEVRLNGNDPARFALTAARTFIGPARTPIANVALQGEVEIETRRLALDARWPSAPAPLLASYVFPRGEVVAQSGSIGGALQIAYDPAAPLAKRVDVAGDVRVDNVSGYAQKLKEPGTARPLEVRNIAGPLSFNNKAFRSTGLDLAVLNTPLHVAGTAALLQQPIFDLNLRSNSVDTARLIQVLRAANAKRGFGATQVSGGRSSGRARITGEARRFKVDAEVMVPDFAARDGRWGALRAASLSGTIAASSDGGSTGLRANLSLPGLSATGAGKIQGTLRSQVLRTTLQWTAGPGETRLQTAFDAGGAQVWLARSGSGRAGSVQGTLHYVAGAQSQARGDVLLSGFAGVLPRYGTVRGQTLRLNAAAPGLNPLRLSGTVAAGGIDAGAINLAALAPAIARRVRDVGILSGQASFVDWMPGQAPAVRGSFQLARATINDFRLRDIAAQASYKDGRLRLADARAQSEAGPLEADLDVDTRRDISKVALTAPRLVLDAARLNPYLAARGLAVSGPVLGRLTIATADNAPGLYETKFDLNLPKTGVQARDRARHPIQAARLTGGRLQGRGALRLAGAQWKFLGDAILTATRADLGRRLRPGTSPFPAWLSGANAKGVRLTARGTLAQSAAGLAPVLAGSLDMARAVVPVPASLQAASGAPRWLPLQSARVEFVTQPGALQLPRAFARIDGGQVRGHLRLARDGELDGQILAERFEAARLRDWLPASAPRFPALSGLTFARADLSGTTSAPRAAVQVRLLNGAARLNGRTLPIDMARAAFSVRLPGLAEVPIEDLTLWSRGGRVSAKGKLLRRADALALDLDATLHDLRLHEATQLLGVQTPPDAGEVDGLFSGDLRINGTLANPRVEGRAAVRLAQAYGIDIDQAQAQLLYESAPGGPRLVLAALSGQADDTPFSGGLEADVARNMWKAVFKANGVPTARLLELAQSRGAKDGRLQDIAGLPLGGGLRADIDVSGTLHAPDGRFAVVPRAGTIAFATEGLRWRGGDLGTLVADLNLQDGVLQASRLELRPADRAPNIPAPKTAPPSLRVTGALPVSLDTPDLNAEISLQNGKLSLAVNALEEIQRTLAERKQTVPLLDRLAKLIRSVPGLEGDVNVDAVLSGRWREPVVTVKNLMVSDVQGRVRGGSRRKLPSLMAAFVYDRGAIAVQGAELRLASTGLAAGAANAGAKAGEVADDTILRVLDGGRIVPDGEVSLEAEVLNANLSQLAPWVAALRDISGRPIVRGELSQFTFRVGGTMSDPTVTGSILAEDLMYRTNTLDRLRVARFDMAQGQLQITRGNLTIVKGEFQSSAAWGQVPWSWQSGLRFDAPFEVHLPLQKKDFGALAGLFVPALLNLDATAFDGSIDVTGTLAEPQFGGQVHIEDGRFRLNPAVVAFDAGIKQLSGTLRFVGNNRLEIDPADVLRGQLVPANTVQAAATGNLNATQRDPQAALRAARSTQAQQPDLGGVFSLAGNVDLDVDPRNLLAARGSLMQHRYNLQFALDRGSYALATYAGLQDITLGLLWRTGPGEAVSSQYLHWMLSASGRTGRKKQNKQGAGHLFSFASLQLPPDAAGGGVDALLRSRVRRFTALEDFKGTGVFQKFAAFGGSLQGNMDTRSQITLQNLSFAVRNAAGGVLDGTLFLDNRPPTLRDAVPAPPSRARPTLTQRLSTHRRTPQDGSDGVQVRPIADLETTPNGGPNRKAGPESIVPEPRVDGPGGSGPIRLAGTITLSQSTLSGAPAGGAGGSFALPAAPVLDVRLALGRKVRFVIPTLATDLAGAILISGTPRAPLIQGTIFTRSGQVRFPNASARITSGQIDLSAQRDPITGLLRTRADIDATASGRSGRYQITLTLRGPLNLSDVTPQNLNVDVSSNPPLSQDEAFAQLLGTSLRDLPGREGGLRSSQVNDAYARAVINLISAPLFASVERSLEQALGLSSIVLDYRLNEPLGVEIGKAVGERIYISYRRTLAGKQAGQQSPYTLRVDYRIKGNLLLGVQTDEKGRRQVTLEKSFRF